VGGGNYVALLQDPIFWTAIRNTIVFFAVTFVVQTVLGLVFAALLHSRARLAVIYKVFVFVPVVLAPAFMAPVFRQIFAADGPFNWFLEHIGLGFAAQSWLADTSTALGIVTAVAIWNGTGLNFVLYYAAIGQIDPEMLEAARIDGAGNLRVLTSMVFPSVRGTTLALGILSAIGALKTFDIPYLVTAAGPNHATEFLGTYIYTQSIPQGHVGYGAALSIMLLLVAIVMAVVSGMRNRRAA
jgi:ABC-type sugar transport system permease subunit